MVMENNEMLSFRNGRLVFLSMSHVRIDSLEDRGRGKRVTPPEMNYRSTLFPDINDVKTRVQYSFLSKRS